MPHAPEPFLADPPLIIDADYVERLRGLALAAMDHTPEVGDRLLQEVERARVLPTADMPSNVVRIGSQVVFRDDMAGRIQTVTLVMPKYANINERRISVLTPVGAALIGLQEGASIDWRTREGKSRRLTVIRVVRGDPSGEMRQPTTCP
jgi:regulator of nucleoside diphosphate kinase